MAARAMSKPIALIIAVIVVAIAAVLLYYAFTPPPGSPGSTGSKTAERASAHIIGSGSTLLYPQISEWINLYRRNHPGVVIDYNPTGSGAGQAQFFQKVVDFAGTDPPLTHEQWSKYRGKVLQVPVVATAIAIVYNIPGLQASLKLDAKTIARIFRGEIEYWDDPAIAELNPGLKLPHRKIIVVHRSDSSGTTMVFTSFLHLAAPQEWPSSMVGKTIEWRVDTTGRGVGGKGNQGVVELVKQNPYSIAYVELAYAIQEKLSVALVENAAKAYVEPNTTTITAALQAAAEKLPESPLGDWSNALNATLLAPGEKAYPITTLSFLLFWKQYPAGKASAIKDFLSWIAGKGYENMVPGYIALPGNLRNVVAKAASTIEAGA